MIIVKLNDSNFEYDIHSLVKAFYPSENVSVCAEEKEPTEAVRAFLQTNPKVDPTRIRALCIGEMTAQAAREAGMLVEVAKEATVEGLLQLTEKVFVERTIQ